MSEAYNKKGQVRPEILMREDGIKLPEKHIKYVGDSYTDYYIWRSYRSGLYRHFRNYDFDSYLTLSRELFWNSIKTDSTDLEKLGLDLSLPFARKETLDFLGKLTSLNIKPHIAGDDLDSLGIKILQGIYKKWSFKSNEKVEKFWDLLYALMNGTVCNYIGYDNTELTRRYLKNYDPQSGAFKIEEKKQKPVNDVIKSLMPIEDIYIPKIFERNIQKQGKVKWKTQMDIADFHAEFDKYPLAKYVFPGMRIAEDSLYFRLLGGTGTTTAQKVEVIRDYDWITDKYLIIAGGIILNGLGTGDNYVCSPMPFDHKMGPFTWGTLGPLDSKLAYGLSTPFSSKDPHKILNMSYTMMIERELRAIDPPVLTSDIESPELIFGQHKVIPVNDVNAYKEFNIKEASPTFFSMMNSLQGNMTASNQGGDQTIVQSRQPKSAREVLQNANESQQTISNAVLLYYDLIRQQVLLVLKTALQFYTTDKYESSDKNAIRTLLVSDMPLTLGGIGNLKLRIVKEKRNETELMLEGIKESILNGKTTEVVDIPVEFLQNLEFVIEKIDMEPDSPSEIELAMFVENVITPMISTYIPMGLADPGKTMLRHLEKMGESVSDYVSDANLSKVLGGEAPKMPEQMAGGQEGVGQTQGALSQSNTGIQNGLNQSGPLVPKFGAPNAKPLIRK